MTKSKYRKWQHNLPDLAAIPPPREQMTIGEGLAEAGSAIAGGLRKRYQQEAAQQQPTAQQQATEPTPIGGFGQGIGGPPADAGGGMGIGIGGFGPRPFSPVPAGTVTVPGSIPVPGEWLGRPGETVNAPIQRSTDPRYSFGYLGPGWQQYAAERGLRTQQEVMEHLAKEHMDRMRNRRAQWGRRNPLEILLGGIGNIFTGGGGPDSGGSGA